ncbi:hypothetical protein LDENG_00064540, partial [Lucifuga dentata]
VVSNSIRGAKIKNWVQVEGQTGSAFIRNRLILASFSSEVMTNYSYTNMNFTLTAVPKTSIEFRTNQRYEKQTNERSNSK